MKLFYTIIIGMLLAVTSVQGGVVYSTNVTNNWNNILTWSGSSLPASSDTVVILSGHYVNVNSNGFYANIRALRVERGAAIYFMDGAGVEVSDTILNMGTLMVTNGSIGSHRDFKSEGYVNVGASSMVMAGINYFLGGNALFESDSLTTDGTIIVNGRFVQHGRFIQTGGDIKVDGNSGTAATSVADTENIILIDATDANCTAGSITIVDPHHSSMFTLVNDIEITGHNINAFSGMHNFIIGEIGGANSTSGPLNRGFTFGNGLNGNYAPIWNLEVYSGAVPGRQFRTSLLTGGGTYIKGHVHVTNASDFQHMWSSNPDLAIGNYISVEAGSYFTMMRNLTLGGITGVYDITYDQPFFGSASGFRNDYNASNVTANFSSLTINHAGISQVDFTDYQGDVVVADSLTMLQGFIQADNLSGMGYNMKLGLDATHPGKLIYHSGHIRTGKQAHLTRWIDAGVITANDDAGLFPICYSRNAFFPTGISDGVRHFRISGQVTTGALVSVRLSTFYGPVELPPSKTEIINGVPMDALSQGNNWYVTSSGLTGTFNVRGKCGNVIIEQNVTDLHMRPDNPISALVTNVPGIGIPDSFYVGLNGLTESELLNNTLYLSGNKHNLITRIPSKQTGTYSDTATWKYNIIPSTLSEYGTTISPGHTVTFDQVLNNTLLGLDIKVGGTLVVNAPTNFGVNVFANGTEIAGTLDVQHGYLTSVNMPESDTAILITPTGILTNKAFVYVNDFVSKSSGLVSEGTINLLQGSAMHVHGSMKLTGNANANFTGSKIFIDGNSGADTTSADDPLFNIATEGTVMTSGTTVYIINPSVLADTPSVNIKRNSIANIDLRKLKIHFGLQPAEGFGVQRAGNIYTGYMVETKAGTLNTPLGKIIADGGNTASGRFVRNGNNGFFVADSVWIKQASSLWLRTGSDSYIGGHVYNEGDMVSEGRVIFGGTNQFPAKEPIIVKKAGAGAFLNNNVPSLYNFNKITINTEGPSVVFDFSAYIAQELSLQKGLLISNGDLMLGENAGSVGTLISGAGRICINPSYNNSLFYFRRWFNTSTVNLTDDAGLFPFATMFGEDRSLNIFGTPATGGIVSVCGIAPDVGAGNSTGWVDGGVTINYLRGNMWDVKTEAGFYSNSMGLKAVAGGIGVGNVSNVRLLQTINPLSTPGTHISTGGTSSAPEVTRGNINSSSLTGNNFFSIGIAGQQPYVAIAVQNGNWNNPSTWDCNCIPGSGQRAYVGSNYHVVIDTAGPTKICSALEVVDTGSVTINGDTLLMHAGISPEDTGTITINGGYVELRPLLRSNNQNFMYGTYTFGTSSFPQQHGTLNINGGKLAMGQFSQGHTIYSNGLILWFSGGNFNMTGGELNIKGMMVIDSYMNNFNMTGGNIIIDPNSPQADSISVVPNYHALRINSARVGNTISLTGGDIYITNPTRYDAYSVYLLRKRFNTNTTLEGSTVHLGMPDMDPDDMSYNNRVVPGQPGVYTGFKVYTGDNNGTIYPSPLGNVVIENNDGELPGRHVYIDYAFHTKGDVTIEPKGELRLYSGSHPAFIGGDFINNGILTTENGVLNFGGEGYIINNAQTLSGTGRFRMSMNDVTPTAFEPLIGRIGFNNFNGNGVTIDVANLRILAMYMDNGDITVANNDQLTFGGGPVTSFSQDLIPNGTGAVIGKFRRYVTGNIPQNYLFPVGVAGNRREANINYTTPPTNDGYLTTQFVNIVPGNSGLPLVEGTINVNQTGDPGYWSIVPETINDGQYDITTVAKNFGGINDYTQLVLVKRTDALSPWTLQGTHIATTGNNATPILQRTGLTGFSEFAVGGDMLINPLPLKLLLFNAIKENEIARLQWSTANELNMDQYIIERSNDGEAFAAIAKVTALNAASSRNNYSYYDMQPNKGVNYYRLRMTGLNDKDQFSPVRTLYFDDATSLVSIYPNPATDVVNVRSSEKINQVVMYDNLGRVAYQAQPMKEQTVVNLEGLAKGIYIMNVTTTTRKQEAKLEVR